jgi:tyrosinase
MTVRKNQAALTQAEWADFIDAINQTHGVAAKAPRYRDFVKVHVRAMNPADPEGMSWGVHTMGSMMKGRNFLAWHRRFVLKLEQRLQKVHPNIAIPYWEALIDRTLPAPLSDPALLASWSVTRAWDPSVLAPAADLKTVMSLTSFQMFQPTIESAVHASVHNAVGGDMAGAASPTDPLFWLHHANLDRLWSQWQKKNPQQNPPNLTETLKPKPLFGVKVSDVLDITALGYRYA